MANRNKNARPALSGEQIKRRMWREGTTLKQWATDNGYPYHLVSYVIRGINKASYGKGREVAIKLGMVIPDEHDQEYMQEAA